MEFAAWSASLDRERESPKDAGERISLGGAQIREQMVLRAEHVYALAWGFLSAWEVSHRAVSIETMYLPRSL